MAVEDQPTLTLSNPTHSERVVIAKGNHPEWGGVLSLDTYIGRETDVVTGLNRDGGLQGWILTHAGSTPNDRPLLTSCDTLRKRALVRGKDGVVKDTYAQGVASVFTPEDQRGKGYAGRMMGLLSQSLAARANEEEDEDGEKKTEAALFSILFSDVGRKFYAARGWKALESTHLDFPVDGAAEYALPEGVKYISSSDEIAELTALDEKLLRQRLAAVPASEPRVKAAIIPDNDHVVWHLARQNLAASSIDSSRPLPDIHGAQVTVGSSTTRAWALWARKLRGTKAEGNKLYFLRFVVEDPDKVSDSELGDAFQKIVTAARREAQQWDCGKVQLWSPDERLKTIVEGRKELAARYVVRDDSIMSLNWFGKDSVDDVDWVIPEMYTWC